MNSKTVTFWGIMIAGVIAVSVAAWLIGNKIADVAINNRNKQKIEEPAGPEAEKNFDRMNPDERAESISIEKPAGGPDDEAATDDETGDDEDDQTADAADPDAEKIPSADEVSETKPGAAPAAGAEHDELFGGTGAEKTPANPETAGDKPAKTEPAQQPAAGTKKILYRVQIGAFAKQENAAAYAVEAAEKTGLPTKPIKDSATNLYRVQCGAFSNKDAANKLMRELELQGYKVHMSETELAQ